MPDQPKEKTATIQFNCDERWKRIVMSKAALRGQTLSELCVEALTKHLKISSDKSEAA